MDHLDLLQPSIFNKTSKQKHEDASNEPKNAKLSFKRFASSDSINSPVS